MGGAQIQKEFVDAARVRREVLGLNQTDVAKRMAAFGWRWHQQTVERFESGERPPRYGEAVDLGRILGLALIDREGLPQHANDAALLALSCAETAIRDARLYLGGIPST